jgi:hypothetical protein
MVTIRPPKIIPLVKSGGKSMSAIMLAKENSIQFARVMNFKRRC